MFLIGVALGALVGYLLGHGDGMVGGAFLGGVTGLVVNAIRGRSRAGQAPAVAAPDGALNQRIAMLEMRVAGLEQALHRVLGEAPPLAPEVAAAAEAVAAAGGDAAAVEAAAAAAAAGAEAAAAAGAASATPSHAAPIGGVGVLAPSAAVTREIAAANVPPPMPAYGTASAAATARAAAAGALPSSTSVPTTTTVAGAGGSGVADVPRTHGPIWRWLTGGNVLARVGALVLFIGVAFLAKYATERVSVPIELRLTGVAILAIVLLLLGWRLRTTRPGYAVTLQGAGIGLLYLTVFAALALYALLPPAAAFVILVVLAIVTAVLAIGQDAMALAVLAALAGYAAPVLTSSGAGEHVVLFSYYAVLNAGLFAMAWFKPWRALNLIGFACTFIVATAWGVTRYTPDRFASTEPFLVLFFLFYVGIAVAYARGRSLVLRNPVDGMLVFGTPLVVAALQAALVRPFEFGMAFSAVAIAALYLGLAYWLHVAQRGATLLVESFLGLSVVFATLAIPLALDARLTSATWALEGAALVWLGLRQERRLPRAAGLLLQAGAAVAFALHIGPLSRIDSRGVIALPFLNSVFIGALLVALSGGFSAWRYSRVPPARGPRATVLAAILLGWAVLWWLGAGVDQIHRFIQPDRQVAATVAWLALTAAVLLAASRLLPFAMAEVPTIAYLPAVLAMALWHGVPLADAGGHLLAGRTAGSWAAALVVALLVLRVLERDTAQAARLPLPAAHATLLWLVTFIAATEAGWLIGTVVEGRAWQIAAWMLVPAAVVMLLSRRGGIARWPVSAWRSAYATLGAGVLVALLYAGFLVANGTDGDAYPLPFVPVINPLDVAFAAAALALVAWARGPGREVLHRHLTRGAPAAFAGIAGWLWLTGSTARVVHHLTDMPFSLEAAWDSPTLQSALSLVWTTAALAAMVVANRRRARIAWIAGAALLGVVVLKLFLVDLAQAGTVARIVSFIGVGLLLLLVGYLAPVPARRVEAPA